LQWSIIVGSKSDLQRLRRYKYDGEGDELSELVADIHWAADRIELLEAEVKELSADLTYWENGSAAYDGAER
jgi:hypothetical protein